MRINRPPREKTLRGCSGSGSGWRGGLWRGITARAEARRLSAAGVKEAREILCASLERLAQVPHPHNAELGRRLADGVEQSRPKTCNHWTVRRALKALVITP